MSPAERWAASPRKPRANISSPARRRTITPSPRSTRAQGGADLGRASTARSSRSRSRRRKGAETVDKDEQPPKGDAVQDPDAEARLRQGRHDHRGQRLVDLGRRRGAGDDARERRRAKRARARRADRRHRRARARAGASSPPRRSNAVQKVLEKAGWSVDDVDLFEVNEAFACVAMIAMRDLGIDHAKVNVNGGADRARPSDRRHRARGSWRR